MEFYGSSPFPAANNNPIPEPAYGKGKQKQLKAKEKEQGGGGALKETKKQNLLYLGTMLTA